MCGAVVVSRSVCPRRKPETTVNIASNGFHCPNKRSKNSIFVVSLYHVNSNGPFQIMPFPSPRVAALCSSALIVHTKGSLKRDLLVRYLTVTVAVSNNGHIKVRCLVLRSESVQPEYGSLLLYSLSHVFSVYATDRSFSARPFQRRIQLQCIDQVDPSTQQRKTMAFK